MQGIRIRLQLVVGLAVFFLTGLSGQPKDNSPFSHFGLGDIVQSDFVTSYSMGGIGAAFADYYQANIINPASYSQLQSTSLEVGFYAKRASLNKDDLKSTIWSGNIEYFSLTIPLVNPINEILERKETDFSWGMNLSLLPYSRVGYNIESTELIDSIGTVERSFQGNGGTYRFNWGNGWRYKTLRAGINIGYLFGKTSYESESQFVDLFNDYYHTQSLESSFSGFVWSTGVQYDLFLDGKNRREGKKPTRRTLTLGAYINSSTTFNTKGDQVNLVINDAYVDADTALYLVDQPAKGKLPSEFGLGFMYYLNGKWKIGVNYAASQWSKYENEARPEELDDAWRLSAGFSVTPDATSIRSLFDRVDYRAGIFYGKDPRSLENEQIFNFGLTLGMGIPFIFQRKVSFMNLGFEFGKRGTSNLIKENYLRVKLGVSLNDNEWFIKRRFN